MNEKKISVNFSRFDVRQSYREHCPNIYTALKSNSGLKAALESSIGEKRDFALQIFERLKISILRRN